MSWRTIAARLRAGPRTVPEHLRPAHTAFEAQAERVQAAREAMQSCVPVGRAARAPIEVGVDLMRDELDEILAAMPDWRVDELEAEWQRCRTATERARARCDRAAQAVDGTDDGHVVLREVAAIVMPLEVWLEAERHWRSLRTRG
ncbi:hypothetical protein ER308_07615 [Egibacter rhizosphaerae]|uniref:Uncharacterized protein n=1 Tax=Egibacter rhizosphaerae TaxID=1670831 RepID=A0A411YDW9_9ACTN|nr:hypothetical protein [Egibacter rhizosphaerae]QBI19433.1 hypothetical protein ER308_07615 [Egibacter rhizosphaerae]